MQSPSSALSSLGARISSILHSCYEIYPPQAWLQLYYPVIYFAKVVRRISDSNTALEASKHYREKPLSTPTFNVKTILLSIVIFGPLYYVILSHFDLLDSQFWKYGHGNQSQKDRQYGSENPGDDMLHTDPDRGLDRDEVSVRQGKYGRNEIYTGVNWFAAVRRFFLTPVNLVLEAAGFFAGYSQDLADLALMFGLLSWNAYTFIQSTREHDDVVSSLALNDELSATTVRGGSSVEVFAKDLVPGDIVRVSSGSVVPADCRVLSKNCDLFVDQSNITGENAEVKKCHGDACYAGTGVIRGDVILIVELIGRQTFLGRTMSLLAGTSDLNRPMPRHMTDYYAVLRSIGASLVFCILASTVTIWRSPIHTIIFHQCLDLLLGLTIVSVPISIITFVTRFRSHGTSQSLQHGAICQSMTRSVELLGAIDILCVDKTGTLTNNKLVIHEPRCFSSTVEDLILTSSLTLPPGGGLDSIDTVQNHLLGQYPKVEEDVKNYKILDWQPFDPETKFIKSVVESASRERIVCVRGAPKAVLMAFGQAHSQAFHEKFKSMCTEVASEGYRSMGVARKRGDQDGEVLGLLPMIDPPRADAADTIKLAENLGVKVKMFTGDSIVIAKVFSESIDMSGEAWNMESLLDNNDALSSEMDAHVEAASVFAEVYPENKEKIVQILQSHGHLVGATGDGVADAPALRKADCGIAVAGASERAQSVSDIVFQTSGISAIVLTIQTSRQVFQVVYSYLTYRIAMSFHLITVILWLASAYSEVLDLRLLVLIIHCGDVVGLSLDCDGQKTAYSKLPARWSIRKFWTTVIPLSAVLSASTWLTVAMVQDLSVPTIFQSIWHFARLPIVVLGEGLAFRQEIVLLNIVLADHWMIFLTRTNGRFWAFTQSWRPVFTVLCIDLGASSICLCGWVGNGSKMPVSVAIYVWLISLCSFLVAAGLLCLLSQDELLDEQLGGKQDGLKSTKSE